MGLEETLMLRIAGDASGGVRAVDQVSYSMGNMQHAIREVSRDVGEFARGVGSITDAFTAGKDSMEAYRDMAGGLPGPIGKIGAAAAETSVMLGKMYDALFPSSTAWATLITEMDTVIIRIQTMEHEAAALQKYEHTIAKLDFTTLTGGLGRATGGIGDLAARASAKIGADNDYNANKADEEKLAALHAKAQDDARASRLRHLALMLAYETDHHRALVKLEQDGALATRQQDSADEAAAEQAARTRIDNAEREWQATRKLVAESRAWNKAQHDMVEAAKPLNIAWSDMKGRLTALADHGGQALMLLASGAEGAGAAAQAGLNEFFETQSARAFGMALESGALALYDLAKQDYTGAAAAGLAAAEYGAIAGGAAIGAAVVPGTSGGSSGGGAGSGGSGGGGNDAGRDGGRGDGGSVTNVWQIGYVAGDPKAIARFLDKITRTAQLEGTVNPGRGPGRRRS